MKKLLNPLFLGIIAAFAALIIEQTISMLSFPGNTEEIFNAQFFWTIAGAVLVEEILKGAVIFQYSSSLDKKKEILLSSLLMGLGFSLTETGFIFMKHGWGIFQIYSTLGVILIHILTAGFAGCFFLLLDAKHKKIRMAYIILLTFIFHITYNSLVLFFFLSSFIFFYLVFLFVLLALLSKIAKQPIKS